QKSRQNHCRYTEDSCGFHSFRVCKFLRIHARCEICPRRRLLPAPEANVGYTVVSGDSQSSGLGIGTRALGTRSQSVPDKNVWSRGGGREPDSTAAGGGGLSRLHLLRTPRARPPCGRAYPVFAEGERIRRQASSLADKRSGCGSRNSSCIPCPTARGTRLP